MANAVVTVLEADGTTETDITILDVGRQAAAASKSIALATEDKAVLDTVAALSKSEDAAHSSGDTGVQMLAVRKDTSSTGIGANGDYTPLAVDANGKLYTMTTLDASSVNSNGRAAAGSSSPVVLSTEDLAAVNAIAPMKFVDVTLSLDTSAYGSGDLLADAQVVAACVKADDALGILQSMQVIDEDDQKAAFTVYFASASNTWGSENSAPSISDANAREFLGYVDVAVADYKDLGGVSVASKNGLGIVVKPATGTDDIYVAVVNGTGTPTYTASGVRLRLGFI